jgi:hypothetical protein
LAFGSQPSGKVIHVEPLVDVSSQHLRNLLIAIVRIKHLTAGNVVESGGSVSVISATMTLLHLVLDARFALRPFIQKGNSACNNRYGVSPSFYLGMLIVIMMHSGCEMLYF